MLLRIILVTNLSLKAIPVCIHRKHFHFGASVSSSVLDVYEHVYGNLLLLVQAPTVQETMETANVSRVCWNDCVIPLACFL